MKIAVIKAIFKTLIIQIYSYFFPQKILNSVACTINAVEIVRLVKQPLILYNNVSLEFLLCLFSWILMHNTYCARKKCNSFYRPYKVKREMEFACCML